MLSPSATAIEIEKNGMPRFAFSEPSIGSTTTVQRPSPSMPTSSLTMRTSRPRKRSRITASAAASTAVVSSPPSPSPTFGSRSARPGRSTSTAATSSRAARQISSQSANRMEEQAGGELREEERRLLRHDLSRLGEPRDLLRRHRLEQERRRAVAAVDGGDRILGGWCIADTGRRERLDDAWPEVVVGTHADVAAVSVERHALAGALHLVAGHVTKSLDDAVRRKDLQPRRA